MKKAFLLVLSLLVLGIYAAPAMALSADDPTLWWDANNDPVTNETEKTISPSNTPISIDLYLSGVKTEHQVMGFTGKLYTGDLFVNELEDPSQPAPQPGGKPNVTINTAFWGGNEAVSNYGNGYIEFSGSVATSAPWVNGDDILLATFTFDYNQEGEHLFNWKNQYEMFELNGNNVPSLDVDTYAIKVTATAAVPVPGTMILLCTGLLGLVGIRRRA